jgi:hypothetical protein
VLIACWSVKGGSGTTVVAVAHALLAASHARGPVHLAALAGDVPAVLGLAEPAGPGLAEWLASPLPTAVAVAPATGPRRPVGPAAPDGLGLSPTRSAGDPFVVATPGAGGVHLLHRGRGPIPENANGDRLASALAGGPARGPRPAAARAGDATVVVDCGVPRVGTPAWAVAAGAGRSLLVLRPCYLALRRAAETPLRPSSVVLVVEPGRALGRSDVEAVLGVPVAAEIPWDPTIARAVDAGLLASRLPRPLRRALQVGAAA